MQCARVLLLALIVVQLVGCGDAGSLIVEVRTDFVPVEEFGEVRTVVIQDGETVTSRMRTSRSSDRAFNGIRVAEFDDLETGVHSVRLQLIDASSGLVLSARTVVVEVVEQTAISVVMTRECLGMACGDGLECLGGECVDPSCLDLNAPGCSGGCGSDSECPNSVECTRGVCAQGICFDFAEPGSCDESQICVPGEGCVNRMPATDAGVDAGPRDAGTDGGPDAGCTDDAACDDGYACTTDTCNDGVCMFTPDDAQCTAGAGGECIVGFGCQYDGCSPETCVAENACQVARCEGETCVRDIACESGEECCGGTCVTVGCDDGNPCTDDSCGESGCLNPPNSASCSDGAFCNGVDTCSGGACAPGSTDPCTAPAICDEAMSRCVGCVGDSDCPDPVMGGFGACSYANGCAESGTMTRTITSFSCRANVCNPVVSDDTASCSRTTTGNSCGTTVEGGWSSCGGFSDACDEMGTRTRDVTARTCSSGTCQSDVTMESESCPRDTDGDSCGMVMNGSWVCSGFSSFCDESGTETRTVSTPTCAEGSCGDVDTTEMRACSRTRAGQMCEDLASCQFGTCGGDTCQVSGPGCTGAQRCCEIPICVPRGSICP